MSSRLVLAGRDGELTAALAAIKAEVEGAGEPVPALRPSLWRLLFCADPEVSPFAKLLLSRSSTRACNP